MENINHSRRELALAAIKRRAANRYYGKHRDDVGKIALSHATGELNSKHAQLRRAARAAHRQLWEQGKTNIRPR